MTRQNLFSVVVIYFSEWLAPYYGLLMEVVILAVGVSRHEGVTGRAYIAAGCYMLSIGLGKW